MKRRKKPSTGYDKKKAPKVEGAKVKKKRSYVSSLIVSPHKQVTITEKVVKFLIYIALRLVLPPRKWKHPKKNYEIIDRTYKRIMSADFIFIPSSIAFYLIMAFIPILSLIMFFYQLDFFHTFLTHDGKNSVAEVVGKFIPGMDSFIESVSNFTDSHQTKAAQTGAMIATILSLIISTWIAAGGFAKLVFTQSYIFEHKYVGGYWMNKIKGMFIVFSFTLFLFIGLLLNILYEQWVSSFKWNETAKNVIIHISLAIGLFIFLFIGFIILYKFSPRYKIKVRNILPGAMVTTIPTAGFLALFGSIASMWSYGSYGALGVVMYVGMSSLIITYFIFVGIIVNASYFKTFVGPKVRNKWTISKK